MHTPTSTGTPPRIFQAKCKQLQRVVLGTDSRPTDEISRCGDSCQEVMHRLKVIGINFFRRRIGGVMGEKFFPDGLAKVLTLIGRPRVAQGCQTSPAGSGFLGENEASPRVGRRDAQVQVAGGIDAEDEPLMEQQVILMRCFPLGFHCSTITNFIWGSG